MSTFLKLICCIYFIGMVAISFTLVGKTPVMEPIGWEAPVKVAIFMLAAMIPAYFAGKWEQQR